MKKIVTFGLSVAAVAMLSASVIEWDLPNLSTGGGTALTPSVDNIVFILTSNATYDEGSGKITPSATPTYTSNDVNTDNGYSWGTWEDSNSSGGEYYMAFYNDGKYYAINDGTGGAIKVLATADTPEADRRVPGSEKTGSLYVAETMPSGVRTVAAQVPEPATAALALAGLALLIRRRRTV